MALKPDYMKLSLYNLSFRIPVYERSAPFSPLKHKSHYWSRKQSQILSERCTQFSRTPTSSNKGRTKKVADIRLSFPHLRLTVETLRWILKYICTILTCATLINSFIYRNIFMWSVWMVHSLSPGRHEKFRFFIKVKIQLMQISGRIGDCLPFS